MTGSLVCPSLLSIVRLVAKSSEVLRGSFIFTLHWLLPISVNRCLIDFEKVDLHFGIVYQVSRII